MKNSSTPVTHTRAQRRRGERGAALITMLLISTLMLAAGGALILTTGMSALNSIDTVPEAQAYYAAEAGLEAALNVLRGHVQPNPLFNATASHDDNKIDFRRAISVTTSNRATPTAEQAAPPRLSRWLSYNYTPAGAAIPDRVVLSPDPANPGSYSPANGTAYSVTLSDPDNSHMVGLTTEGGFGTGSTLSTTLTQTAGGTTVSITFEGATVATMDSRPFRDVSLGRFRVLMMGVAGTVNIPATQFTLRVRQTSPWEGTTTFTGRLCSSGCSISLTGGSLYVDFNDPSLSVADTMIELQGLTGAGNKRLNIALPVLLNVLADTPVNARITPPEPRLLRVTAIGYGPRGARKNLSMVVRRYKFDVQPPAPIVIRGADLQPGQTYPTEMTFALGASEPKRYSGVDYAGNEAAKPTVAISLYDWRAGDAGIVKDNTVGYTDPSTGAVLSHPLSILDLNAVPNPWPDPPPTNQLTPVPGTSGAPPIPPSVGTPDFLVTADRARAFLNELEIYGRSIGRYYTSFSGMAGNDSSTSYQPLFTFVDGNCTLEGGAGLLVVTGDLTLNGNSDFKGVVLVLGNGRVTRSGGGNGNVHGSWVVARFFRNPTATQFAGFLAPTFNTAGGGNGNFFFDSQRVRDANATASRGVIGIYEH